MRENQVTRIYEVKEGNTYRETYRETDEAKVVEWFANVLRSKYIYKAPTIDRIRREPLYNGFEKYIVTGKIGDNHTYRETYIIKQ